MVMVSRVVSVLPLRRCVVSLQHCCLAFFYWMHSMARSSCLSPFHLQLPNYLSNPFPRLTHTAMIRAKHPCSARLSLSCRHLANVSMVHPMSYYLAPAAQRLPRGIALRPPFPHHKSPLIHLCQVELAALRSTVLHTVPHPSIPTAPPRSKLVRGGPGTDASPLDAPFAQVLSVLDKTG